MKPIIILPLILSFSLCQAAEVLPSGGKLILSPEAKVIPMTGNVLLLSFMARSVQGGAGVANAKLQLPPPDFTMAGVTDPVKFGSTWELIYQTVVMNVDVPTGQGGLHFILGEQIQSIEIADISLRNYGRDFDVTKLPRRKVTYEGRSPDATWRSLANGSPSPETV